MSLYFCTALLFPPIPKLCSAAICCWYRLFLTFFGCRSAQALEKCHWWKGFQMNFFFEMHPMLMIISISYYSCWSCCSIVRLLFPCSSGFLFELSHFCEFASCFLHSSSLSRWLKLLLSCLPWPKHSSTCLFRWGLRSFPHSALNLSLCFCLFLTIILLFHSLQIYFRPEPQLASPSICFSLLSVAVFRSTVWAGFPFPVSPLWIPFAVFVCLTCQLYSDMKVLLFPNYSILSACFYPLLTAVWSSHSNSLSAVCFNFPSLHTPLSFLLSTHLFDYCCLLGAEPYSLVLFSPFSKLPLVLCLRFAYFPLIRIRRSIYWWFICCVIFPFWTRILCEWLN